MTVRFAEYEELGKVNELRKQVNDLHVDGKPEVFKAGFAEELRELVYAVYRDPRRRIVVCEDGGTLCGYAVLNHVTREENPFMFERDYLDVDEFGVALRDGDDLVARDEPLRRRVAVRGRARDDLDDLARAVVGLERRPDALEREVHVDVEVLGRGGRRHDRRDHGAV